ARLAVAPAARMPAGEAIMRCRSCHAHLSDNDNYCRKCGAAVEILDVQVVQRSPARQVANLRATAMPVVTSGATAIVAGTILRFALRRLFSRPEPALRNLLPFARREPLAAGDVEEVLYYRRSRGN